MPSARRPVLSDLFEIAGQHVDRLVDFGAGVFAECGDAGIGGFLQLVQKLDREAGKVVDEVERVFDLVGDAGGQLTDDLNLCALPLFCSLSKAGIDQALKLLDPANRA